MKLLLIIRYFLDFFIWFISLFKRIYDIYFTKITTFRISILYIGFFYILNHGFWNIKSLNQYFNMYCGEYSGINLIQYCEKWVLNSFQFYIFVLFVGMFLIMFFLKTQQKNKTEFDEYFSYDIYYKYILIFYILVITLLYNLNISINLFSQIFSIISPFLYILLLLITKKDINVFIHNCNKLFGINETAILQGENNEEKKDINETAILQGENNESNTYSNYIENIKSTTYEILPKILDDILYSNFPNVTIGESGFMSGLIQISDIKIKSKYTLSVELLLNEVLMKNLTTIIQDSRKWEQYILSRMQIFIDSPDYDKAKFFFSVVKNIRWVTEGLNKLEFKVKEFHPEYNTPLPFPVENNSYIKNHLDILMGKNNNGEVVVKNLHDLKSILVAGNPGSGKSVQMVNIVASLIQGNMKGFPTKMLIIDPKGLDFNKYNSIPGVDVVICGMNENEKDYTQRVIRKLDAIMSELFSRAGLISDMGVKDTRDYYLKVSPEERQRMPEIVVIIDELSDLILSSKELKETILEKIQRISQKCRAYGGRIIIGTQKPTYEVLGDTRSLVNTVMGFKVKREDHSAMIMGNKQDYRLTKIRKRDYILDDGDDSDVLRGFFLSSDKEDRLIDLCKDALKLNSKTAILQGKTKTNCNIAVDNNQTAILQGGEGGKIDDLLFKIKESKELDRVIDFSSVEYEILKYFLVNKGYQGRDKLYNDLKVYKITVQKIKNLVKKLKEENLIIGGSRGNNLNIDFKYKDLVLPEIQFIEKLYLKIKEVVK